MKVLVVDDEKFVRQGLIQTMPWDLFNLEVIGEASNGKKAIEYLERNPVDVIFTDLMMPFISGLELMSYVREKYPEIWIVILTCHQDFHYIQESLRLGAIDYIVKTQLKKDVMKDTLERIVKRIHLESALRFTNGHSHKTQIMLNGSEDLYIFCSIHGSEINQQVRQLYKGDWSHVIRMENNDLYVLGKYCSLSFKDELNKELSLNPGLICLHIRGIPHSDGDLLVDFLPFKMMLFYEYVPEVLFYEKNFEEHLLIRPTNPEDDMMFNLREKWMSFRWVYNDEIFSELLNLTKQTNADPLQIKHLFYQLALDMGRIEMYRFILKDAIKDMDHFHYWANWRKWVEEIRELIKQGNGHVYAEEIVSSIMKALEIVQQNLGNDITRDDIANRVSMSKAYFSLCFKDIIGVAFGDYVKDLRLKRAHELLLQTQKPIYWVAEQCGFKDEKYFSKLFREHLGILPNELRKH